MTEKLKKKVVKKKVVKKAKKTKKTKNGKNINVNVSLNINKGTKQRGRPRQQQSIKGLQKYTQAEAGGVKITNTPTGQALAPSKEELPIMLTGEIAKPEIVKPSTAVVTYDPPTPVMPTSMPITKPEIEYIKSIQIQPRRAFESEHFTRHKLTI